jgi:hypothetical protein
MSLKQPGRSKDDLQDFFDWAEKKGLIKEMTVRSLRTSCNQVFELLDQDEAQDLSRLNIDEIFERFKNKRAKDFTPDSLKTYRSRVSNAVKEFLEYTRDPEHWRPSLARRASRLKGLSEDRDEDSTTRRSKASVEPEDERPFQNCGLPSSLTHYFPLRKDVVINVSGLPNDLKVTEAKRLSAYLLTLCEDFNPPDA